MTGVPWGGAGDTREKEGESFAGEEEEEAASAALVGESGSVRERESVTSSVGKFNKGTSSV